MDELTIAPTANQLVIAAKINRLKEQIVRLEHNYQYESSSLALKYASVKAEFKVFHHDVLAPFTAAKCVQHAKDIQCHVDVHNQITKDRIKYVDAVHNESVVTCHLKQKILDGLKLVLTHVYGYITNHKAVLMKYLATLMGSTVVTQEEPIKLTCDAFIESNLNLNVFNNNKIQEVFQNIKQLITDLIGESDAFACGVIIGMLPDSKLMDDFIASVNRYTDMSEQLDAYNARLKEHTDMVNGIKEEFANKLKGETDTYFEQVNPDLYARYIEVTGRWISEGLCCEMCGQRIELDDYLLMKYHKCN